MALALVTGTSSGIGLATAVALARAGHTVVATMRNLDGGAEIRKIAAAEKLPIHLAALNVDDDASVREAFAKVVAEHGPIDVLVNNAGIPGGGGVEETTIDRFREVMETNFFGALRCAKVVIPSMRERRRGTIVNVTSVAGRVSGASHGSYAASKWALEAVSESLAQELRPFNVRVAIVEPGVIATPIFTKAPAPTALPQTTQGDVRGFARQAHPALGRRRRNPRHRCKRQRPIALSRWARRRALNQGARQQDGRAGAEDLTPRTLVRRSYPPASGDT